MKLPKLRPTFRSVNRYIAWVAESLATDLIETKKARELLVACKTMLSSMATRHTQAELEDAREILAKMERATRAKQATGRDTVRAADDADA